MRQSGILMHVSSLPSTQGIGKIGEGAYAFVDFLVDSGVSVWQILPLTPTSYGDSPYQSFSVFAGNPYFIDFDQLEKDGWLITPDYASINWGTDPRRIDYTRIYTYCFHVLRVAFGRFDRENTEFQDFCKRNAFWLDDYALFMALKDANEGKPWYLWEKVLTDREPQAIEKAKDEYAEDIAFYQAVQFWFFRQWEKLKTYVNSRNISIIGDIPIYVAYDSADVWANPKLFLLNENLEPKAVAGCPPDIFSPTGQLWGNPLYDWSYHKETKYAWWISRLEQAKRMYDTLRIDHFRGFESYYAVPYGKETVKIGIWQSGPGVELFQEAEKKLGKLSIIAEDLGFVTQQVRQMLKETGFPGMKVLQFAFDGNPANEYLPQNYTDPHCIVYTGTHDNPTLRGWLSSSSTKSIGFAKRYLHCRNVTDLPTEVIRAAWSSIAQLAVAQMQDFLEVGADGRMNTPSTIGQNWQFRTVSADFTARLAKRIFRINELYNRLPELTQPPQLAHSRKSKTGRLRNTAVQQVLDQMNNTIPNRNNEIIKARIAEQKSKDSEKEEARQRAYLEREMELDLEKIREIEKMEKIVRSKKK